MAANLTRMTQAMAE